MLRYPGAYLKKNGYSAVQLGFDEVKPKRLTGGQLGHLKRNNLPPLRFSARIPCKRTRSKRRRSGES